MFFQIRLGTSESKERRQEYCLKVASLHEQLGDSSAAVQHFQQLLDGPLAYTEKAQHLHVECQLADVQVLFCMSFCIQASMRLHLHKLHSVVMIAHLTVTSLLSPVAVLHLAV